ncbi:MAG: hypothetical protein KatS3mg120_0184 [Erythrobacter sp.]|nr:MAG: hypothetical protein KatS3mg120_0184 [Erythrobacter sp.]
MKADHGRGRRAVAAPRRRCGTRSRTGSDERLRPVRRAAAAPVHRPRARDRPEVILMDEPCLGARPDRDRRIEDLIVRAARRVLDRDRHAQHAAGRPRLASAPPIFHLGRLVEVWADRRKIFTNPRQEAHRGLHHREVRVMAEHTVKAFDEDITRLRGLIAEMGGLAEVAIAESLDALVRGDEALADQVVGARQAPRCARDRGRQARRADHRAARADGRRSARGDRPRSRSAGCSSASAIMPRTSPSAPA